MADTATSKPFMITLPSGTKLYGITITDYIKDGNNVKPVDPNKGSPMYYYTEIPKDKWKGPSDFYIQYTAPGTGSPKFYQIQGVYNRNGDGKWAIEPGYGGAELQQEFAKYNAGKPTQVSTVVATAPKAVAKAANVPESGLSATLFKTNTGGDPQKPPSGATPTTPSVPNAPQNIPDPGIESSGGRSSYGNYYYPETLINNQNKQDIIKFTAYSYGSRPLEINGGTETTFGSPGLGKRDLTRKIEGSVTLPIQPSITDTNSVTWGNEELNPLQAYGAGVSYAAQENIAGAAEALGTQAERLFRDSNFKNAARIYLAGKAVGVNGLLSRVGGAILNPNVELLFQGPQLRPFTFNFRLSPRSKTEAEQVKYIIRFFKQNMSIKNTQDNLFLKAPNVFQIRYLLRGEKDHPSLNRIKICALQSCTVDYTPDGSYMTFNEEDASMTSYNLTLQFQELEPITEGDYNSNDNYYESSKVSINEIGY